MAEFSLPDYVVIRPAIGMDPAQMPPGLDGRWYDLACVPFRPAPPGADATAPGGAVASPSGRVEVREDGAVAEVWELSWWH